MSIDDAINVARAGPVLVVTLNRPFKVNALTSQMYAELGSLAATVEQDRTIRCIALLANGPSFCSGADLEEIRGKSETDIRGFEQFAQDALVRLENSAVPVVAGARGVAVAGGLEVLLVCDLVIASESLAVGDGHIVYGLIPGGGASQRLPRIIGSRRAADLLFTGRQVDAITALQIGLVNEVVPDAMLNARVLDLCAKLSASSDSAMRSIKELLRASAVLPLDAGLTKETEASIKQLMSADGQEGLSAFKQRRKPQFVRDDK